MIYTREELQKLRIYHVYFWRDEEILKVTPIQAAWIKQTIQQGLNYFEIGEDMYMVKDIRAIRRDRRFIEDHEIEKNLENPDDMKYLTTGFYTQGQGTPMYISGPQ